MRFQPYACLDGNEISNGVRVLRYIRDGAVSGVNVSLSHTCSSNPTDNSCLACYCAELDDSYYNPKTDPAPWFTSNHPASEEFLGFWASNITLDAPITRTITPRSSVGSSLGPMGLKHRIIQVEGIMFAASVRGMSYGERWLHDVLLGGMCVDCGGGELELLPACLPDAAPDNEEDEAFRTMLEVGLIEGPEFEPLVDQECAMQRVSFQLAAGHPYLYAPAEPVLTNYTVSTDTTPQVCATYRTDSWPGDATTRIEIQNISGIDITNTNIRGHPSILEVSMYPSFGTISADYPNPCMKFRITHLNNEESIVIDSRYRQVLLYDVSKKRYVNGMDHIAFEGLFTWGDIGPCTEAVVCMKNNTTKDMRLNVWAYRREL